MYLVATIIGYSEFHPTLQMKYEQNVIQNFIQEAPLEVFIQRPGHDSYGVALIYLCKS